MYTGSGPVRSIISDLQNTVDGIGATLTEETQTAERNAVRAVREVAKNGPLGHGILPGLLQFGQNRAQRDKHIDPNGLRPQTVLRVGDITSLAATAESYGAEPRDVGLFQVDPFSKIN